MSLPATQSHSSFVPQIPDFSESFFDREDPLFETSSTPPNTSFSSSISPALFPAHLNLAKTAYSAEQINHYRQFLTECLNHSYIPSPYGTVCPGHPEANHPYPGPMPENPHQDKKVIQQFIQRGLSKKFREQEREFKNNFRHWQAQMNQHLAEVPSLRAKDALLKSFLALVQTNFKDAAQNAQEALNFHAYNPTAYALLAIAAYEENHIDQAKKYEQQLQRLQPSLPLGDLGQKLINEMVQDSLSHLYTQTCEDTTKELQEQKGVIPLQKDFLAQQIERNLWKNLQQSKEKEIVDFLDLIGLYFLEETLFEDQENTLSVLMSSAFRYIGILFEHLEINLNLIKAHSANMTSALRSVLDSKTINKEQLHVLIQELSKPLKVGDYKLKRDYMNHAMHIQLYKKLFEMNANELASVQG